MNNFHPSQIQWREPWKPLPVDQWPGTIAELHREMCPAHVLFARSVQPVARREDCDDVLFYHGETAPQFAVVHLTYARETEPEWPCTTLFDTLDAWIKDCMIPDAEQFAR